VSVAEKKMAALPRASAFGAAGKDPDKTGAPSSRDHFDDGHEAFIVKFGGAPERMQPEIQRQQGFAKLGRLVFDQPAFRRVQRAFPAARSNCREIRGSC
jgi:hypothetical protein